MLVDIYEFFTGTELDVSTLDPNITLICSIVFVILCIIAITKTVKFFFTLPTRF